MKSKKDSNDNNNKMKGKRGKGGKGGKDVELYVGGEKVENVSYFQLYRYSTGKDKLMIFVGIIGALLQGATLPFMINSMGEMTNVFISLVVNTTMKKLTGINDDNILKKLLKIFINGKTDNLANDIANFQQENPNVNLTRIMEEFNKSGYSSTDLSAAEGRFEFKTIDDIFYDIYKFLIILGVIGIVSFIASFLFYAFLNVSSSRQTTKIRSLVFNSLMRQEIAWHEKTSPGELSSRIVSDTILIEDGISIKLGLTIQNFVTFIACFILAYINGWRLSLAMSRIIPLILVVVGILVVILKKYTILSQDAYAGWYCI